MHSSERYMQTEGREINILRMTNPITNGKANKQITMLDNSPYICSYGFVYQSFSRESMII